MTSSYDGQGHLLKSGQLLEQLDEVSLKTWLSHRHGLFPALYSLVALAAFVPPVVEGLLLGLDPSVRYWFGYYFLGVLLVPALQVASHVMHSAAGRPLFLGVVLSTIIPSVIIVAVGNIHLVQVGPVADRLASTPCASFDGSSRLDDAYRAAEEVFGQCVRQTAASSGAALEVLRQHLTLQDCPEYGGQVMPKPLLGYEQELRYLSELQLSQDCTGWCSPAATPLWVGGTTGRDACVLVAANTLSGKVKHAAERMLIMGLIELFASIAALSAIQENFIKEQVEW